MLNFGPNPKNRLYTNLNSYLMFLGYVLAGRFWQDRSAIETFERALGERFGTDEAVCVYQCRLGIYLAVKATIAPGQEVILSPYTIADVINMVIFAGGKFAQTFTNLSTLHSRRGWGCHRCTMSIAIFRPESNMHRFIMRD